MADMPPLEDDPTVTETFADGPVSCNFFNGNMHLTFYAVRSDHRIVTPPGAAVPQIRRVVLRLVLPYSGAAELQSIIRQMIDLLQTQGLVKPIMSGPVTRQ
jgi:hypothetical protein